MALFRLWASTSGPNNADNNTPVSLGTEVVTTQTLWITHLHYWRGTTADDGTHTGEVFNSSTQNPIAGTVVTFTDVGTGWQTAALSSPVQIPAGAYLPTAHHPNGGPAYTSGYWTTGPGSAGITNGPITAPNNAGSIRGQGLYTPSSTRVCPTLTFGGNNYWVDWTVSDVPPDTLQLTASASLTASGLRIATGAVDLAAQATLAATGQRTATGTAALSAAGVLTAVGARDAVGAVDLAATADLAATGSRTARAQLALAARGDLIIGDVPSLHLSASAALVPGLHLLIPRPNTGTIHRP